MKYLNIEESELKAVGGLHTAREIAGQPDLWIKIFEKLVNEESRIIPFLKTAFKDSKKIILTGAGTSAFIGYSVEGTMQRKTGITTLSVATTHLVSHPYDYLDKETTTLIISFARSGNSPESIAAIRLADNLMDKCYHLIITCSEHGDLAKYSSHNDHFVFLLPPESNDKSLAMTGSYSGMLLTALALSDYRNLNKLKSTVDCLIFCANDLLLNKLKDIRKISSLGFSRAVFLGSGPLFGTAMESHLKLQELTDGLVICKNDSYLGFRHGPKAVVDEETLLVYYFSNNKNVLQYEIDLVRGMDIGKKPLKELGISMNRIDVPAGVELLMIGENTKMKIDEAYLPVCYILLGQLLAFYKSMDLQLKPDSPSKTGAISRVVQGVKIY